MKSVILVAYGILIGISPSVFGLLTKKHAADAANSIICTSSAVPLSRLEEIASRNDMGIGLYTHVLFGKKYCSVRVESRGDDHYEIKRAAATCEPAAIEVLKTLEARNVR